MFWFIIAAAGAVAASRARPEVRIMVEDVPWMPLAVAVGLVVLGGGIHDGLRNMGADTLKNLRLEADLTEDRYWCRTVYRGSINRRNRWGI